MRTYHDHFCDVLPVVTPEGEPEPGAVAGRNAAIVAP